MNHYLDKTIKTYNEIAEEYAKKIEPLASFDYLKKFTNLVKKGWILDCGCAAGRDSYILKNNGLKVTGIDLSEKLLNIARKKHPNIEFIKADIRKVPFKNNSFDGIWASAVIHHLNYKDMIKAIKEFKRVLKPGGILFLSTKYGTKKINKKDKLSINKKREFFLLTKKDLITLIKKTKLKIIDIKKEKEKLRNIFWLVAFLQKTN